MASISNTINNTSSFLNLGPNGTSASTSTMLVAQNNQNAISAIKVVNATAGTAARTDLQVSSDGGGGYFGTASSLYTGLARFQNKAFITTDTGMAGVVLDAPAASGTVTVYTNSILAATFTASQTLTLVNPLATGSGGTGVASPTAHSLPVAEGASAFTFVGPLTNGQLLIGSTGADPVAAAITAGTGITISNTAGAITISAAGEGATWTTITSNTQMVIGNGYITNSASQLTVTLPATAAIGDVVEVAGLNTGGWLIAQNASQLIHIGSTVSTTGTGGSVASTNQFDTLQLKCIVANTTWTKFGGQGNWTVT